MSTSKAVIEDPPCSETPVAMDKTEIGSGVAWAEEFRLWYPALQLISHGVWPVSSNFFPWSSKIFCLDNQ